MIYIAPLGLESSCGRSLIFPLIQFPSHPGRLVGVDWIHYPASPHFCTFKPWNYAWKESPGISQLCLNMFYLSHLAVLSRTWLVRWLVRLGSDCDTETLSRPIERPMVVLGDISQIYTILVRSDFLVIGSNAEARRQNRSSWPGAHTFIGC